MFEPIKVLHTGCDKADIKLNEGSNQFSTDPVDEVQFHCDGQVTDDGLILPGAECQKSCLSGEFWLSLIHISEPRDRG